MRQFWFLLFPIFLFYSCKDDNHIKPDYSFNKIVDSSFYCTVKIGDVVHKFPYHIETWGYSSNLNEDSVRIGYFFSYVDSTKLGAEDFSITISKTFRNRDLKNSIKIDSIYYSGRLSNDEILSVFQQGNYSFSTYNRNYDQCTDCELTSGISIVYDEFWGSLWKTSYTALYLNQDSIDSFYQDSKFSIINLQVLDDSHIVIEGTFDVKIFNWYSGKYKRFSEGYFKAYKVNY